MITIPVLFLHNYDSYLFDYLYSFLYVTGFLVNSNFTVMMKLELFIAIFFSVYHV